MPVALAALLATVLLVHPQADRPPAADPGVMAIQVALDRAGFSPGVIDGREGALLQAALDAYRSVHEGDPPPVEPLTEYTITDQDVQGPFAPRIPEDLVDQADLPALAYTSVSEALAERFHTSARVLAALNPDAAFTAGEQIHVPNVEPFILPAPRLPAAQSGPRKASAARAAAAGEGEEPGRPQVLVTVSESARSLSVRDGDGRVLFHAPVTTGSERDPLPIGEWRINGVQYNPTFHYNPALFWDADPSHAKATIAPGPNNPVGVVWIDLTKEHYGIHGTPEPDRIGYAASHGCVRLTNWDAVRVAGLVQPGTRVVFTP
jgi:lipoprotein-anchoring transpeptidase ErfK/SrfK